MIKSSTVLHLNRFIDAFHDTLSELCFLKTRLHYPLDLFGIKMSDPFTKNGICYFPQAQFEQIPQLSEPSYFSSTLHLIIRERRSDKKSGNLLKLIKYYIKLIVRID